MHVSILLDSPYTVFTNLDFVRGKVVLNLPSMTAISSVTIKLEGESKTRMMTPGRPDMGERPMPREEYHKLLYKVETVLGAEKLDNPFSSQRSYTLAPGRYEYPFDFKIPFNNACYQSPPPLELKLPGLNVKSNKPLLQHVKTTLPPTVTSFPGLAEVRYYVKVTVNRKEFYKENPRVLQNFTFIPIEPPRPPPTTTENYARRQHSFVANPATGADFKMKNLFAPARTQASSRTSSEVPPMIGVDARLPNPAIITCNQDIPLRLLVKRLNSSQDLLYLRSLHIELVGHTKVRAIDVFRKETNNWIICSHSNINVLLDSANSSTNGASSKKPLEDVIIDSAAWRGKPIPNSVASSFQTFNIERSYELLVRVGIGYGSSPEKTTVVLPLQLQVTVYSGRRPPDALLNAMSNVPGRSSNLITKKPLSAEARANVATAAGQASVSNSHPPPQPPRPEFAPLPPDEEEPPPSYEDAIGHDIGPVDGPRNYQPPAITQANGGFPNDSKSRRGS